MSSLIKQDGRFYLQFFCSERNPRRKRIALRTSRKREALALRAELDFLFISGRFNPWTEDARSALRKAHGESSVDYSRSLGEGVEAFIESRSNCRSSTIRHYGWVLDLFSEYVGSGTPLEELTGSLVSNWLGQLDVSATTRWTYFTRVRVMVRWLRDNSFIQEDITRSVTIPRPPDKLAEKLISPLEVNQLVIAARLSNTPYMAEVIELTFDLALRLSEVCALEGDWIDWDRGVVMIRSTNSFSTKTGKTTVKPLTARAKQILERLSKKQSGVLLRNSKGGRLDPKRTSKRFKSLVRRSGLRPSISFHSLRHGSLSLAVKNGAPIEAVRKFAGHSTSSMTMRYVHLNENDYLDAIVESLEVK